jgi:hypothetical protein
MRKFIVLLFCFIPFACTKDAAVSNNSIAGVWTLTHISGGIAGQPDIPLPPGENYISFEGPGKYHKSNGNAVLESGTYSIRLETTILSAEKKDVIYLVSTEGIETSWVLELNGNVLSLNQNNPDGINYVYIRKI